MTLGNLVFLSNSFLYNFFPRNFYPCKLLITVTIVEINKIGNILSRKKNLMGNILFELEFTTTLVDFVVQL